MNKPIVVIGIGEMSGVFSRALLRAGHPLYPVTRSMSISETAEQIVQPELVLVAVAEADLDSVLEQIPGHWKDRIALLQNELLPADWQKHQLKDVTVISVWFEKKPGQDFKVLIPSPIMGPKAALLAQALNTLAIPTRLLEDEDEMLFELVRKNLYILTTNIAGLEVGGSVNDLWHKHRSLTLAVMDDVITIQNHLTGQTHDRERLIEAFVEAINGDLAHKCMGRSAPARLKRALQYAHQHHLSLGELHRIAAASDTDTTQP